VNVTLVPGHGCQGSVGLSGKGSVQIVDNGLFVWMMPSDSFYKSLGVSAAEISVLSQSTVGYITFSDYNRPVTITPPPASKILNGGELGPQIGPLTV
jgi:hypothetical protein